MRVLDCTSADDALGAAGLTPLPAGTAACLGAFDGMHRGHQGLVARAKALAEAAAVVTFEPRPSEILAPGRAPPRLQSSAQREHVCRELGVDALVILPFNREVSRMSPAAFAEAFLIEGLRPATVVVGYDFHFGAKRAGDAETLARLLDPAGIEVSIVEKIAAAGGPHAGEKLGSTAVRELVARGEVEKAAGILGRLYALAGVVEHGAGRGRGLGYPTANVDSAGLHPAAGVYACVLSHYDPSGTRELDSWPAVANLGTNPTFTAGSAAAPRTLEVHALDVDLGARLYGERVEVAFVARLRDEQRFASVDELREAIAADVEAGRAQVDATIAARRHARPVVAEVLSSESGAAGGAR